MNKKIILECCGRPEGECVCLPEPSKRKGQQDRLLTDKEMAQIILNNPIEEIGLYKSHYRCVAEAQDAKTASIMLREWQAIMTEFP